MASRAALPAAGQQTLSWAVIGGNFTDAGAAPRTDPVTETGAVGFTVVQPAPAGSWNGDFTPGDSPLVMFDAGSGQFTNGSFDNIAGVTPSAADRSAQFVGAFSSTGGIARAVISGLGPGAAINQITLSAGAPSTMPAPATLLLSRLGAMRAARRRA